MDINIVIMILNRANLPRAKRLYEKNGFEPLLTMLGNGTATSSQLSLLGLNASEKALIAAMVEGSEVPGFFRQAKMELTIDVPGNGVMMSVPVKSIGGGRSLAYMTNGRKPDPGTPAMDFKHELILIITNSGYTDDVMDVARSEGAGGGTVIHAKGTGAKLANKFFGISLAEEKEVILIAETAAKKSAIMRAVAEKMGPGTPAGAIAFSVPLSEIAGIRNIED